MKDIRKTDPYKKWFKKLKDSRAKARIFIRIERLAEGNPGDVKPIGEGCSEMRIDYGPGYRVYFKDTGNEIIILLCGGVKGSQQEDITNAKTIAENYILEEEEEEDGKDKDK
jgi:putative addiction module killer protein